MKVLHFFKTYYPETMGGIEQVIFQLAEGGREHGVSSEVLYLSEQGRARDIPFGQHIVHRSKLDFHIASTGFSLSAFKDFKELASEADIINYHFPWPFMDVVHFCTRLRKPTVLSYHSDIVKQKKLLNLYQPLMYRFLADVDHIVATSQRYVDGSPVLLKFKDKLSIIPIGIKKAAYPNVSVDILSLWRASLGERFYLFVGALRYYKGLEYLIEAATKVNYPIVIVGCGPMELALKMRAQRLGVTNVRFLGALSEMDKTALLQLCYGFVFPSHLRSEAFGISLLEAAMFGKPLISCEIGTGTTDINIAGETGLVVPPGNPQALANAMSWLWERPVTAFEMGNRAALRFERIFTAESMTRAYAEIYHRLLC